MLNKGLLDHSLPAKHFQQDNEAILTLPVCADLYLILKRRKSRLMLLFTDKHQKANTGGWWNYLAVSSPSVLVSSVQKNETLALPFATTFLLGKNGANPMWRKRHVRPAGCFFCGGNRI